jgi:ligand-binding sensor domain-containing protein
MCSLQQVSESYKHNLPLTLPVKKLLFFILFLSVFISGYSQQNLFRIYTVNDGLISNAPQQIFQDDDGFIWIGSNEGMSIYDGNHFVNYTSENKGLSDNIVNHFFQKDKNEVWVLHSNGIDVFVKRKFKKTLPVKQGV